MIEGKWHAKDSAASFPARLIIVNELEYRVTIANGTTSQGKVKKVKISDRIGNIERKLTLADGSLFATKDNDRVDETFKKKLNASSFIHTMESKYRWVIIALIITILASFSFFKWGVPWTSKKIAHALPEKTNQLIAAHTLDFLDKFMFDESKLGESKQENIRKHFQDKLVPLSIENKEIVYKLHFRDWSDGNLSIPNALALPSGDIVLTDKFVELCKIQEEMDSVLLHEMGHVVHRHTLEMVIEGAFVSVAVMMMVGDSNGLADMGVGLGSLLVSASYSRGHESEADMYAFKHMLVAKIDPSSFSKIMNRMTAYMEDETSVHKKDKSSKDKSGIDIKVKDTKDSILDYLSSHPSTDKRVEIANAYSECFKKGLSKCEVKVAE